MILHSTGKHLAVLALTAFAAGCGGDGRNHVAGSVTFAGKPVAAGRIYFAPDLARGNDGPQGFAAIQDGRYDTAASGVGGVGGPVVVRIDGYGPPTPEYRAGKPLFLEYRVQVELPKGRATKDFDVPAAAALKLPAAGGITP